MYCELVIFYEMQGLFWKSSTFSKLKSLGTGSPLRVVLNCATSAHHGWYSIYFSPYRVWLGPTSCSVEGLIFCETLER
jgi:hypothetical protein